MDLNHSAALEDLMRLKHEAEAKENEGEQFRVTVNQYRRSQEAPEKLELNAAPALELSDEIVIESPQQPKFIIFDPATGIETTLSAEECGRIAAEILSRECTGERSGDSGYQEEEPPSDVPSESGWLHLSCDESFPSEETVVERGGPRQGAVILHEQRLGEYSSPCRLMDLVQACKDDHNDGTLANAVVDEVDQTKTEHLTTTSSESLCQKESLRTQEHSSDRLSSWPSDTSTPESGSLWLAEFSEDDDKELEEDHPFIQFKDETITRVFEVFSSWKGKHSEQDTPYDGAGKPNSASNQDKGKDKHTTTGKRALADQSESSNTITGSSGPLSNRVGCGKRRRMPDRQLTFACPYTKKDPMSYRDCYKYKLSRIRDVKQHLARCHRNPPYCPRCMGTFETEEERDEHIREFSCPSRPSIRLDGITESQRSQLAKKSTPNSSPEAQWFAVFDIVFPGHKPRPASSYVDSELLQDITHYQDFLTINGPRIISEVLSRRGVVTWHLPNEGQDLAAFQQTVFEEGLGIIFEQWLARRSSSSQDSIVPSGSGSSSQNTPPSSFNSRDRVGPNAVHESRAVPPVTVTDPPDEGPVDALPEGENIPANSADHFSFGEGSNGTFGFEHGGVEFPAGSTCDVDEMMWPFMDDAQASSEFPPDLG